MRLEFIARGRLIFEQNAVLKHMQM